MPTELNVINKSRQPHVSPESSCSVFFKAIDALGLAMRRCEVKAKNQTHSRLQNDQEYTTSETANRKNPHDDYEQ